MDPDMFWLNVSSVDGGLHYLRSWTSMATHFELGSAVAKPAFWQAAGNAQRAASRIGDTERVMQPRRNRVGHWRGEAAGAKVAGRFSDHERAVSPLCLRASRCWVHQDRRSRGRARRGRSTPEGDKLCLRHSGAQAWRRNGGGGGNRIPEIPPGPRPAGLLRQQSGPALSPTLNWD